MQIVDFYLNEFEFESLLVIMMASLGLFKVFDMFIYHRKLQIILSLIVLFFSLIYLIPSVINPKITLTVKYINKNVDENEINISKEQIINDILSGKITQNKNNLPVYSQEIPITEEEYKKLNKYKEEYDKKIENGNVNITD